MNTQNGPMAKFANYRKILERKAGEVRRSLSSQKARQVVSRLDVPGDEGDLSQKHHEEWLFLNRNSIDMGLLRGIDGALRRMERGTYGVCRECGEEISIKRLNAIPWAIYCVPCQEALAQSGAAEQPDEVDQADGAQLEGASR